MLLLLTLLAQDGGAVLRILARAKQVSLNELARRSAVNKSNLIRFINSAEGGYLSETARRQVLLALDWTDGGPRTDAVHALQLDDAADASYLLRVVFEGKAKVRLLGRGAGARELVFIGQAGDACLLLRCASTNLGVLEAMQSSTEALPGDPVDPALLEATIEKLSGSPRFFRMFLTDGDPNRSDLVPQSVLASAAVRRFFAAGHTLRELEEMIERQLDTRVASE